MFIGVLVLSIMVFIILALVCASVYDVVHKVVSARRAKQHVLSDHNRLNVPSAGDEQSTKSFRDVIDILKHPPVLRTKPVTDPQPTVAGTRCPVTACRIRTPHSHMDAFLKKLREK
jgi:hypothetical protein